MSWIDGLPSGTPRYKYEGIQQCLRIIEQERYEREASRDLDLLNPYLVIDIDERSFLECFVNSGENLLTLSWEIYDHSSHFTILKMESGPHSVAAGTFNLIFGIWARGVRDNLIMPTNTKTIHSGAITKRADISWTPFFPAAGRSANWPTFVGEVAYSQTRQSFLQAIEFWLKSSNGDVKTAITIHIRGRGRITIEQWARNQRPDGSMDLRFPEQKIEIQRSPEQNSPRVTGKLTLPFRDIFLRDKKGKETDFVLTRSDMEEIAERVWAAENVEE